MTPLALTSLVLAGLNGALAILLFSIYWRNHRAIASSFTLAFVLFATFALFHAAIVAYQVLVAMMTPEGTLGVLQTIELLLQTSALAALTWASMR